MNKRVTISVAGQALVEAPICPALSATRRPHVPPGEPMTPDAILALYDWGVGSCFRCARAGAEVTPVGAISTPSGDLYELAVCEQCILAMERERRAYAKRRGLTYAPGSIGS